MSDSEEQYFEALAKGAHAPGGHAGKSGHHAHENHEDDERDSDEKMVPKKINENNPDTEGKLTIDVYQTPSEIVVQSAIAGISPDDLDINVSNDSITIRGERSHEEEIEEEDYFYQECYWGRFSRSVILPEEVDPDGATVKLKNGILTVKLPKANKKKAKKLKVNTE